MKKLLLFSVVLALSVNGFSQKAVSMKADKQDHTSKITEMSFTKTNGVNTPAAVQLKNGNQVQIERVDLGMSGNVFSVLRSKQTCLAYDEPSNTLLGTYRADPDTYPGALASGTIMGHTSSDGGSSWNHSIILNPDPDVHALRYPSGVLYNHEGSSDPASLYAVVAGPAHTLGTWDYTYFGAASIDGSNNTDYYKPFEGDNDWDLSNMTTVPGAVYFFGREFITAGSNQGVDQTMRHYVGTTDDPSDEFEWEMNTVTPDWYVDADGIALCLYDTWSAWSRDGSIGYMWMIGVSNDSEEYGGYQPQVYYTEDSGDSWDEIELNMEDHPTLVDFLPPWEDANGNPGTVKPTMGISAGGSRNFPGVVDFEGKLHLFAPMFGMSVESAADPESGYWNVAGIPGGHIFDIVLNTDGLQDIIFVDSVLSSKTPTDYWGDTPVDWDHRIQASKSLDEKVVFAVWADDATNDEAIINNPDLKGWAYNADIDEHTDAINFTETDLYAGFFYFHYVSELTPLVNGNYEIPVSITLSPGEFGSGMSTAPCSHYFLEGISFPEFVGIEDGLTMNNNNITVAQNQPNPFTGTTSIKVSSSTVAPVMVEVSNIMGQTVYTVNAGTINGIMNIELNANDLESGVYFYTVRIGNESISKKMIVE